jgi:hypothetical protein
MVKGTEVANLSPVRDGQEEAKKEFPKGKY